MRANTRALRPRTPDALCVQLVVCDGYPKSAKAYGCPCHTIAVATEFCFRFRYPKWSRSRSRRYLALHDGFPISEVTRVSSASKVGTHAIVSNLNNSSVALTRPSTSESGVVQRGPAAAPYAPARAHGRPLRVPARAPRKRLAKTNKLLKPTNVLPESLALTSLQLLAAADYPPRADDALDGASLD
jgi:hypothetical protein